MGPAEAIRCHENRFLYEEDYVGMANASKNPTRRQVNYLHDTWREINLGSFINPLEMLKSKLDLYESNGKFNCLHFSYNLMIKKNIRI